MVTAQQESGVISVIDCIQVRKSSRIRAECVIGVSQIGGRL
jgi:hypothetical protein